jgi:hypothetical protein
VLLHVGTLLVRYGGACAPMQAQHPAG